MRYLGASASFIFGLIVGSLAMRVALGQWSPSFLIVGLLCGLAGFVAVLATSGGIK